MSIKTIIFDLGGVYFTDGTSRAIKIISERYSLDNELVSNVFKGEIGTKYRKSEITHDEFWTLAKTEFGIDESIPVLADIWLSGYVPISGTVDIVHTLKNQGYELLFLSDNVQERIDYLTERYDFLDWFKDGVFSHLIGTRKPDIKMYTSALEKTSSLPEECIYIDDKEELLVPAKQLGMKTIHFISPEQLLVSLESYGIAETLKNK